MSFRTPFALALVVLVGCAYTQTHRVITGRTGPAFTGDVAVFMAGTPPPPYEEVGIVQAVGRGGHADLEHVVEGLKSEAASLGCSAVVNVKIDQGSGTASGTAICARLLPPGAPSVAPQPVSAPPPPAKAPVAAPASAPPAEPESPADGGSLAD